MNNISFVTIVDNVANDLIRIVVEKHLVIGYKSCSHVNQYVISGFDYKLDYIGSNDKPNTVNLNDYQYIVFDYANSSTKKTTHVKLIKGDPTQDIRDLTMKIDELLADKQYLTAQVNKLLDNLSDRDMYISKLKGMFKWQKTMIDVIQDMYSSLLDESKKEE